MPGMDGIELATTILKKNNRELFPIIFITARPYDEEHLVKFYESGIIDYIAKPFRKFILVSKIKILLELNRQKQEIAVSEKMYRMLLDATPEGIVIMDLTGRIQDASTISLQVFGVKDKDDLIGKDFFSFVSTEDRPRFQEVIDTTIRDGLIRNVEFRLIKTRVIHFISEVSTTLIHDNDGNPNAFMAIIRDISHRKKTEQQRIQTERMASLGEMASGIAHEINQPLNNISIGLENLLAEITSKAEVDQDYIAKKSQRVFDNVERIAHIIDHIRSFSRGQDDDIRSSFKIEESVRNSVAMVSEQFKEKNIELKLNIQDNISLIAGNTYKLEQVIVNLLINAKDAIEEKKEELKTEFQKLVEISINQETQYIILEVADNGIGISQENIDHILVPFYTTKETGKGLGLPISYRIIKELNGTMEIQSERLKGTTVRIIIPLENVKTRKHAEKA